MESWITFGWNFGVGGGLHSLSPVSLDNVGRAIVCKLWYVSLLLNASIVMINFLFVLSGGAGDVDSLFQSLGHVSRAVGTLVNIMTDDEATDGRAVPPATARAGQTRGPRQ